MLNWFQLLCLICYLLRNEIYGDEGSTPEIIFITPSPMQRFDTGAVIPIEAFLYSEEKDKSQDQTELFPGSWALALTIDDGETTTIPGASLRGEVPGLSDGRHSISIALVDAAGDLLGPRARAHFSVGADAPPLFAFARPPAGILWRDSPDAAVAMALQIDRLPLAPGCCEVSVHLDGVAVATFREWRGPAGGGGGGGGADAWAAEVASVGDGLHSAEAVLRDPEGEPTPPPPPPPPPP